MKRIFLLIVLLIVFVEANAASLSLDTCYALARKNYPQVKQMELIAKSKEYTVDNVSKGYFPQFTISGQATHQSDVTQIPISFPGINIAPLPKDQYKMYA